MTSWFHTPGWKWSPRSAATVWSVLSVAASGAARATASPDFPTGNPPSTLHTDTFYFIMMFRNHFLPVAHEAFFFHVVIYKPTFISGLGMNSNVETMRVVTPN